jgi:hypothetical protein
VAELPSVARAVALATIDAAVQGGVATVAGDPGAMAAAGRWAPHYLPVVRR